MHLDNREKFIFPMPWKDREILMWSGKCLHKSFITRNMKTNRSCILPQHAGTSWWSTKNFCVNWLTMLIFCVTAPMIWYRNIQSHVYTCIYKVGCLLLCIHVCTHLHTYTHACTYMHILMVTDFMSTFWYHLSYFTILPCMLILLKCVLCITIIRWFVSNDEIKIFHQSLIIHG